MLDFESKNTLILGLGREGLSTYLFLRKKFPDKKLSLADQSSWEELVNNWPIWKEIKSKDALLDWQLGEDYLNNLDRFGLLIKTAGIPLTNPQIQTALDRNPQLEISSNMAIFFDICPGKIIGITGSKGKSTTTQLIYEILKNAEKKVALVGNIGRAALNHLSEIDTETLVIAELSSHQLAELKASPQIAIVQNITPEHLDYFINFEAYLNSKTAIARFQKAADYLIFNPQLEGANKIAALSPAQKITHSLESNPDATAFLDRESLYWRSKTGEIEKIIDLNEVSLLGKHNLYNILPAIIVAKLFEISNDSIKETIKNFHGLPHRLELVTTKNGIKYVDDSIGTNPIASAAAIRSFPKGKVILLAGGYDKMLPFDDYVEAIIEQKVKALILFPPTGKKILALLREKLGEENLPSYFFVDNMPEAVELAKQQAQDEDVVLLSTACASFGLFKNYQDRGQQFQEAVNNL